MDSFFTQHCVDAAKPGWIDETIGKLTSDGLATFIHLDSPEQMLRLARSLGSIYTGPRKVEISSLRPRSDVPEKSNSDGYLSGAMTLHTDQSQFEHPPEVLINRCARPAPEGGDTLLADGRAVHQHLRRERPDLLDLLTTPACVLFTSGEDRLAGAVFNRLTPSSWYIRFRFDYVTYFSGPLSERMKDLLEILQRHTLSFSLQKDQGYAVQNGRWLHGRTAFSGERELQRVWVKLEPESAMARQIGFGFGDDP